MIQLTEAGQNYRMYKRDTDGLYACITAPFVLNTFAQAEDVFRAHDKKPTWLKVNRIAIGQPYRGKAVRKIDFQQRVIKVRGGKVYRFTESGDLADVVMPDWVCPK